MGGSNLTWEFPNDGPPHRLTFGTGTETSPSIAQSGSRIAFADLNTNYRVWSLPLNANAGKVTGEPVRLTDDPAQERFPFVSADGRKVAFNRILKAGQLDLWLKELPDGKETPLVVSPASAQYGDISPDGSRVAYDVFEITFPTSTPSQPRAAIRSGCARIAACQRAGPQMPRALSLKGWPTAPCSC